MSSPPPGAGKKGIVVSVRSEYLPDRSSVANAQYAFAYTVRISNQGAEPAQLVSRHWLITDADGQVQEVRGPGVVGQQPLLRPGQHFEYTSWAVIATPWGSMRGSYQMVRPSGDAFDAEIASFRLGLPRALN